MLNRRAFLGTVGAVAAAALLPAPAVAAPAITPGLVFSVTCGWAPDETLRKGDRFTIAGVYAVNSPGDQLQEFVVTNVIESDEGLTLSIRPKVNEDR